MDNKRVYKRISTCFWFMLATLPWWLLVLQVLLTYLLHFDNNTAFNAYSSSDIISNFGTLYKMYGANIYDFFYSQLIPSFLKSAFVSLFSNFGLSGTYSLFLVVPCAWFCWVYFIELIVDFVVWLPRLCHNFMERWCKD